MQAVLYATNEHVVKLQIDSGTNAKLINSAGKTEYELSSENENLKDYQVLTELKQKKRVNTKRQ